MSLAPQTAIALPAALSATRGVMAVPVADVPSCTGAVQPLPLPSTACMVVLPVSACCQTTTRAPAALMAARGKSVSPAAISSCIGTDHTPLATSQRLA